MPLYRSDAFVLRTYALGEADQIVVLFTQEFGKLRVVARQSRNPRRQTASYYQPLMLLHAIVFGRLSQPLYRFHSIDIIQAFRPLREDFGRLRCGLYMTELLDVSTQEHATEPALFHLFRRTLETLAYTTTPGRLMRQFEILLLIALGYAPQLNSCVRCGNNLPAAAKAFSALLGGLLCPACALIVSPTLPLGPSTLAYLRAAMASETAPSLPLDTEAQQELEQVLHVYLTTCLGCELKSYAFLHL